MQQSFEPMSSAASATEQGSDWDLPRPRANRHAFMLALCTSQEKAEMAPAAVEAHCTKAAHMQACAVGPSYQAYLPGSHLSGEPSHWHNPGSPAALNFDSSATWSPQAGVLCCRSAARVGHACWLGRVSWRVADAAGHLAWLPCSCPASSGLHRWKCSFTACCNVHAWSAQMATT